MLLVYAATVNLFRFAGAVLTLFYHLFEELAVNAATLDDRNEENPCWFFADRAHEDKVVIVGIGVIDPTPRIERHARLAYHLLDEIIIGKDLYEEGLELRALEAV